MLARADVVLTIGYDPVEYDPSFWNVGKTRTIIHLDSYPSDIDNNYEPELELRGAVPETVRALTSSLEEHSFAASPELQAI